MKHFLLLLTLLLPPLATLRAQTRQEADAFLEAVKAGDRTKIEFAVRRSPVLLQRTDATGQTALHLAAAAGQVEIVQLLVERGAKLEARTKGERVELSDERKTVMTLGEKTPLQGTADPQTAAYLLGKGARLTKATVTCAGDECWSLRMWKPAESSPELLAAALKAGADPNERCAANAGTCCHPTAYGFVNRPDFFRVLLAAGLDPNLPSFQGHRTAKGPRRLTNTLLHEASRFGHVESVRLLLAKGAKVDAVDAEGKTALSVAQGPEVGALLKAAGAK